MVRKVWSTGPRFDLRSLPQFIGTLFPPRQVYTLRCLETLRAPNFRTTHLRRSRAGAQLATCVSLCVFWNQGICASLHLAFCTCDHGRSHGRAVPGTPTCDRWRYAPTGQGPSTALGTREATVWFIITCLWHPFRYCRVHYYIFYAQ